MTKKELNEMTLKELGVLAKDNGLKEKDNSMVKKDYVKYIFDELYSKNVIDDKVSVDSDNNSLSDELLYALKQIEDNWDKLTNLQREQIINTVSIVDIKRYINKNSFTVNISSPDVGEKGYAIKPNEIINITPTTYKRNRKVIDKRLTLVAE